ncbi:NAD-dependent protein deacetylase [Nannocystaceae bacterium ST9]
MIPELPECSPAELDALVELLAGKRVAVLTGAGCSTESGIPDYRGEGTSKRARNPIKFDAYVRDPIARARYWARSLIGWPKIAGARPNPTHLGLAALERESTLVGVITQNVDRLHRAAGSREVVELHGALAEVRCLSCAGIEPRAELQARLLERNPSWRDVDASFAPDGDADFDDARSLAAFTACDCLRCGGVLKPDVVFFGESVPSDRVVRGYAMVEEAEALLVLGSSLAVFSGLRFVKRAAERRLPIAIVNAGPTRGDPLATLRLEARVGELIPRVVERLRR